MAKGGTQWYNSPYMKALVKLWKKAWWGKVLVIFIGYVVWPVALTLVFCILPFLIYKKVKNSRLKWGMLAILSPLYLFFISAFIYALFNPSKPTVEEQKSSVAVTPTPQAPLEDAATPTDMPSPTAVLPTLRQKPTVGYSQATVVPTVKPKPLPTSTTVPQVGSGSAYTCNCSKTCKQISSCAEAQYQLNSCGCGVRDGDGDGIACDAAPLHCQN